jgi:hypothetical protein
MSASTEMHRKECIGMSASMEMHRNECFYKDAHSIIVSPRSMQELMASPWSKYAHSVLYIGHRFPATF